MSERSKEHDWKSCVLQGTEGSNPSLSAINNFRKAAPGGRAVHLGPAFPFRAERILRAELIAGSRATVGYEPRQVRKEATAVTDTVCRGGAQLSVVPANPLTIPSPILPEHEPFTQ